MCFGVVILYKVGIGFMIFVIEIIRFDSISCNSMVYCINFILIVVFYFLGLLSSERVYSNLR